MPAAPVRAIKIAILAMGGEGGGVLADWIVDLAEHGGFLVQTTSVPGVAQRTGATIYYLELFPRAVAQATGKDPVLALMPVPGDVDIVIASELMEAGRAVQRGFVTPDRTALIASTHRVYSMTEKIALADGRVSDAALIEGCRAAARSIVAFNMAAIAEATGSVISAVLFGALAGASALPFRRDAFEAAIRRGGVGVAPSVSAFTAGFEGAQEGVPTPTLGQSADPLPPSSAMTPPTLDGRDADAPRPADSKERPRLPHDLTDAVKDFTEPAATLIRAGIERLVDYQDADYARQFLARIQPVTEIERGRRNESPRLLAETARQLALAMSYEDTIRVAELKIRASRFARVRDEVRVGDQQLLEITEYMHPRVQEIADTLPSSVGRWLLRTGWIRGLLERVTSSGRVVKTTSLGGFLLLYAVAALKPLRPRSLRFTVEQPAIDHWLTVVVNTAPTDYALAVEVAEARNLVRGYGDTHERGRARFDTLMGVLPQLVGTADAAARFAELRKAAQADETGASLAELILRLTPLPRAAE